MSTGIIYLIQPCELVGTNRFKIGCSKDTSLNRVQNGYKKGTRYLYIAECNNPLFIEKQIITQFNIKFKLIAGREYFEGNEEEIKNCFYKFIKIDYNKEDTQEQNTALKGKIKYLEGLLKKKEEYIDYVFGFLKRKEEEDDDEEELFKFNKYLFINLKKEREEHKNTKEELNDMKEKHKETKKEEEDDEEEDDEEEEDEDEDETYKFTKFTKELFERYKEIMTDLKNEREEHLETKKMLKLCIEVYDIPTKDKTI